MVDGIQRDIHRLQILYVQHTAEWWDDVVHEKESDLFCCTTWCVVGDHPNTFSSNFEFSPVKGVNDKRH